jgi:ABC-type branched-subunit amino acid transport system substrate-binding protein
MPGLHDDTSGHTEAEGDNVTYESRVEPIKLGYLFDFVLPEAYPAEMRDDLTRSFELVFDEGLKQGLIDRPVEIVFREVEGLPKGTVKAVIDAYGELVDEGCLAVFGPAITDNCVPTREAIEQRFQVPAISVTGTEDWLGEWTFSLSMGSMTDEPIFWADLLAKGGHAEAGLFVEQSLVGQSYATTFRRACRQRGIRIVAEEVVPQTAQDVSRALHALYEAKAQALVHCGFGFGIVFVNPVLEELGWDPPRLLGTAFQNAWINPVMWNAIVGWTGIDQYDEANVVGQRFLDQYEARYGRRPEYCVPVVNRDLATVLLHAFADAHPLSPRGVKEALERVKMLPAASGAPGTRISFGKWNHRGWMGAGYLVARRLDADGRTSHLVDRFGQA